ncbi:succinate-semialdehyde dehydrogenase / glutarate-semialdehyde dehydrogenase [Erythrobacter litoralis]|uniref:Aldehyde dehydrogenase n=1 Tax=Erythrobacter litoralis TaxID=39960 RepID=A0A074MD60_9SPHN|nr:NAD-dependent succinate-semialdehyde dehydrogenase [Erythrobacter litoralis]AOL22956.1 succinate-semialdehyde dehydrogenase / glutarate-semialdehyde dehydrogenase [Erythrobacter litoralis]KEO92746.1 aldehyde dehydrogenase [Erythrobacter litoralis]
MTTYPEVRMLIGGEWIAEGGQGAMQVVNPATEKAIGSAPKVSKEQLDAALAAADSGFAVWRDTPAIERYRVIRRAAELLRERAETIARVVTLEMGKPHAQALGETTGAADLIDFLAEEAKRQGGRIVPARSHAILEQRVTQEPVGPAVLLTPWNFPINLPAKKIGGALAAGCSAILKPAETTPASAQMLVECFVDAGLPDGVLNLVHGDPAMISEHLIASPVTRKVSFTGSTAVGKQLGVLAAQGMKRFTPELGGHAPVVIGESADFDRTVAACAATKFRNAGQVCVSPTRFLVARGIYDRFVAEFAARSQKLKVGDASSDESVEMGPLAHAGRVAAMTELMKSLGGEKGEIVAGGSAIQGPGHFFQPTVIAAPSLDSRLMVEEPFGPVAGIVPYDDIEEAVRIANSLRYGLAAYAFTASLDESHYLGRSLRAGMVAINHFGVGSPETPFGGTGDSGFGSESGVEGYLGYTETKLVTVAKAGA